MKLLNFNLKLYLLQIHKGHEPGVKEIVQSRKLFESSPYSIEKLPIRHRVSVQRNLADLNCRMTRYQR